MNKKIILYIAVATVPNIVRADGPLPQPVAGSGVFGANRRVLTVPGYNGVRGSFTVPTFRIPTSFYAPKVLANTIVDGNSANSKPGFYIGCRQDPADTNDPQDDTIKLDVDAGVIWETRALTASDGTTLVPSGFAIFVLAKGYYAPTGGKQVNASGGWRASVGGGVGAPNAGVTKFDLTWRIYRRKFGNFYIVGYGGYLEVNAVGAGAQPTDSFGEPGRIYARGSNDSEQLCDTISAMQVKRVVAINQGGRDRPVSLPPSRNAYLPTNGIYEEDGSYLRGCVFGGVTGQPRGEVLSEFPVKGAYDNPTQWTDFSLSAQGTDTGYYPSGYDQTLGIPRRPLSTSRKYFEFPGIPEAFWDSEDWDPEDYQSRYDNETVNINLRNARAIVGNRVVPGSGTTSTTE